MVGGGRTRLRELRGPFDGFVEKAGRATTTCLSMADHNRYSVNARAAGRMVLVRSHAERIVVLCDDEAPEASAWNTDVRKRRIDGKAMMRI